MTSVDPDANCAGEEEAARLTSREWSLAGPAHVALAARKFGSLASDRVRVRFLFCGLCGSDISKYRARGEHEPDYPLSIGHEFVARVVGVGSAVADDALKVGTLVTSDLNYRCRRCEHCVAGRSHLCVDGALGLFSNRGFADYSDIDPSYLDVVAPGAGAELALVEPLSCVLHACDWALATPASRILVIGAGGIGLCLAFALAHDPSVAEFDVVERMERRRSLVAGAVGSRARPLPAPDGQYPVVFDVSGTVSGLQLACGAAEPGGIVCSMSHLDGADASFLLPAITRRDITFKVSYLNGERGTVRRASELLTEHFTGAWLDTIGLVPFEDVDTAFAERESVAFPKTIVQIA